MTQWFLTLFERLRHSRARLRCPACWRWASPKTFVASGREWLESLGNYGTGPSAAARQSQSELADSASGAFNDVPARTGQGEWRAAPYYGVMDQPHPAHELASLRDFLKRLESNELSLRRKGIDVTQEEFAVLKREIDHLEGILARAKSRDQNA
jgi:hypothetical protein